MNENPRGPGARAEDVADSDNIARGTNYKLFAVQIGSLICWVVALVVGEGKELFFCHFLRIRKRVEMLH